MYSVHQPLAAAFQDRTEHNLYLGKSPLLNTELKLAYFKPIL